MKPTVRALFLVLAVVLTAQHAAAEEWHGIKPGHSTRADVVRVFGECSDPGKRCEFVFENDEISIDFSTPGNCHSSPPGTVLLIKKVLKDAKTIEALGLDQGRFKSFDPSFPKNSGYRAFVDEQSGLLFKTLRGDVFEIYYIPAKNDELVCTNYYGNYRELLQVVRPHVFWVENVVCPSNAVDGERVVIEAFYSSYGHRMTPTWLTTGGRIVAGQGTRKILLDTTGLAGKVFTVTVEVNNGNQEIIAGSCSITVSAAPKN